MIVVFLVGLIFLIFSTFIAKLDSDLNLANTDCWSLHSPKDCIRKLEAITWMQNLAKGIRINNNKILYRGFYESVIPNDQILDSQVCQRKKSSTTENDFLLSGPTDSHLNRESNDATENMRMIQYVIDSYLKAMIV